MLEAVIFDMDGVLIDSEPIHQKLEHDFFSSLGITLTIEEHNAFIGTTAHHMWSILKDKFNLPYSIDALVQKSRNIYSDFLLSQESLEPINGVSDLIHELYNNNIKLAVASSSPLDAIEIIVKKLNLRKYFSFLVTGDDVQRSKPSPDIFLRAAKLLNTPPEKCLIIEDSFNGITAARAAGIKCMGYNNPNSGNQDLSSADIIIEHFSQVNFHSLNNYFLSR